MIELLSKKWRAPRALPPLAVTGLVFAASACATTPSPPALPADIIVVARRIYTASDATPTAQALAAIGGRFTYVGTRRGAMAFRGPATRVIELPDAYVYPGFADAHAHLVGLGLSLRRVSLNSAASYDEVIACIVARAADTPRGEWIIGRGWDHTLWGTAFPTEEALSRAVPQHPVAVSRVDGHAMLANALAMRLAGVTRETQAPEGGRIERHPDGRLTGVFVDNANSLIERAIPDPTAAQIARAIVEGAREANRWGLTSFHTAGESSATIDLLDSLAGAGALPLRTYVMVSGDSASLSRELERGPRSSLHDGLLWVRSIKLYADGALGSRGAALLAPYGDDPGNTGLVRTSPAVMARVAELALARGFQMAIHAIGDRGNRMALDAYETALAARPTSDHRFRIEHAQVVAPDDFARFARLRVIASMQPSHQMTDMRWAELRIGPARVRGAYAWRTFLRNGVLVPSGSDAPVEPVNPLVSFYAAISRQDADGNPPGGWYPDQKLTRHEALKAMTVWPASAAFQEDELGAIEVGKYADFVVLDRDIMTVEPRSALAARTLATYLGGREVFAAAPANQR